MADKYNAVVTNVGASYVLANNVYNEGKFQISRIEICDKQISDLSEAMNWQTMAEGGCSVVTVIDGVEEVNKVLRKIEIDDFTAQLRITLGPEVGDINNPTVPYIYGSIAVYLAKYASNGEIEVGKDVLWIVGSLDSVFYKYMNSNLTAGNTVSFYLQAAVNNKPEIDHINIEPTAFYSLPTVDTEHSPYLDPYYNTFQIWNFDESETPVVALLDRDGSHWNYISTSAEEAARVVPGGGIYGTENLPSYITGISGDGIVTILPMNTVIAFPDGLGSDKVFKTKKVKSTQLMTSEDNAPGIKEVLVARNNTTGVLSLRIVSYTDFSTDIYEPVGNNLYWYDREHNKTYFIDGSSKEELQFVHIAQYRILDNGDLQYFHPCNTISAMSQSDLMLLTAKLDILNERVTDVDNSAVHKAFSEEITGQKTFSKDVIIKNVDGEVEPALILSGVSDTNCQGVVEFKSRSGVRKSSLKLGVDEDSTGFFDLSTQSGVNEEYIRCVGSEVEASDNIKYSFTQNIIGYDHKDGEISKAIIINGKWQFAQDIIGTKFTGTATSALWADLAENYESDEDYPIGTLVKFGGEKEITISEDDSEVEAVISENPGFLLNRECPGLKKPLALVGRVRVRVAGSVQKGDYIYHSSAVNRSIPGVARSSKIKIKGKAIVGKALETNNNEDEKLVMCVVRLHF